MTAIPKGEAPVAVGAGAAPGDGAVSLRIECLQDRDAVLAARDAIEELCRELCEANVFFEPWFLFPAMKHLGANDKLHFLLLYEGTGQQRLCGFLPLVEMPLHPLLPLKTYQAWSHSQGFRCTPLIRRGFSAAFWRGVLSWLEGRPWHRRLLDLQRFPAEGKVWQALQSVLEERSSFRTLLHRHETAFLRTGSSYDAVLDRAMSKNTRNKLRGKSRRLAKAGSLVFAEAGEGSAIEPLVEEFLELESSGWKGRAGTALASSRNEAAFFGDVIRAAYDRGRLIFLSLRLDGRMIAARCAFLAPSGAFHFKSAYDESLRRFSPGTLVAMEETRRMHDPADSLRAELTWADSCAGPDDGATYHCWPDRMTVARLRIATRTAPQALPLMLWPLVKRVAQALSRS